jgi:two-component system KDP operon response regulator KdpE
MTDIPSARIMVVDDEPQIRKFLDIGLRTQGYVVRSSASGRQALEMLRAHGADLVILDIGLPDIDGHEVLHGIRTWSQVPVIMLSVRAGEAEKVQALDAGANDYITKPFGMQELMARIRALLRDVRAPSGEPSFDDGKLSVDLARRVVLLQGASVHLSRKEFDVLAMLVRHRGRVVTQQQLLREIWGPSHVEDTQYLRIVVGKLRLKLGDDASSPRYLATEPAVGYRFLGE